MRKKTEEKRLSILNAALEAFCELGFEQTSMMEICRRVGFSSATLYNYFSSKEALFFEVILQASNVEAHAVRRALDQAPHLMADALQQLGERLLTRIYAPEVLAMRRLVTSAGGFGEFAQKFFECGPKLALDDMTKFLHTAVKEGKLRQCDAAVATYHLRALLESELLDDFIFQRDCDLSPENIKLIVSRAVLVFLAAYGPSPRKD